MKIIWESEDINSGVRFRPKANNDQHMICLLSDYKADPIDNKRWNTVNVNTGVATKLRTREELADYLTGQDYIKL